MARTLKNCFIFGRIGVKPMRLVFGGADAPKPPEAQKAPEAKEAPGSVLDQDVARASMDLKKAIAEVTEKIENILNDFTASPAKRAAAEKARAALAAIKGGNETNQYKQQTLNEVQVILEYHLQAHEVEVKVGEYRNLLNEKLPWIKSEEAGFDNRKVSLTNMGVNPQLIARFTAIHYERRQNEYNLISTKFPKITGKEQVTLAMFAADQNAFTAFSAGLEAEKNALSASATLAEIAKTKAEVEAPIVTAMNELNADVRLDAGRTPDTTVKHIEAQYVKYKGRWEQYATTPNGIDLDAAIAKVQSLCLDARTKAQQAGGPNPALERAMLLAQLEDDLNAHYQGKENDQANVLEMGSRAGGAPSTAATQTPGMTREVQGRIDRLENENLKALVAGAPGEYRDALLKIAERGEIQGERITFKLPFNKTFYDCDFVKEPQGRYRIKLTDHVTNKVEPVAIFGSKEEAMRKLKDGIVTQGMAMKALTNPQYYKYYEKQGVIDLKGKAPQGNEKGEVTFRLDWKGTRDITGNPIVTARAQPYGMVYYTVNRNGVGFRGENTRSGLASSVDDFFRQLEHLQKWSENFKEFAGKPGWDRSPQMIRELNYFSLNNPANFYQHEARIGRPVHFGVSPKTVDRNRGYEGDVDMILDWGGGPTNDREQNPYIRMKLQPDGTINYAIEYKGRRVDVNNAVNVAAVIEGLAYYKATWHKPEAGVAGPVAPGAPPTQIAGTPGAAPAEQGALQTPGGAPGGAPPVAPGAPVAGGPAGGPAEGAKTPEGPADKAKDAAKKAENAKNTAEAAQKRVGKIVDGAQGKDEEVVNKAITEARAEAEKAKTAAEEAKKAAEEAKKAVDEQKTKAEEAKKTADKAEAEKAPNSGALRTQSRAETASLTDANKASKEAEDAMVAADKAANEAAAKAASLTTPPAAPATAPDAPPAAPAQ